MDSQKIAKRLVELRNRAQKSREQVASDLGVSLSAIAMYESGLRIPRDEIKIKIASYYGESIESVFFNP